MTSCMQRMHTDPAGHTCQSAPPGSWASRSRVLQSVASLSWNRSRSSSRVNLVPPCSANLYFMTWCAAPRTRCDAGHCSSTLETSLLMPNLQMHY